MLFENTLEWAQNQDANDKLAPFRNLFHFPISPATEQRALYFTGNSLGLQPKNVDEFFQIELNDWANLAVEGHFLGKNPWFHYHKFLNKEAAKIVGAKPSEVVLMNNLTVNLHLMMVSFYKPTSQRYKIIIEGNAFPSDHYAVASQARFHGFKPDETIIELHPRNGEYTLRTEDIIAAIEAHADSLALVMIGGVNYYTGQLFDMETITIAGHKAGAKVGFDLAHAAGNVPLHLHNWDVDFAVWCTYKYLNSGPGSVAGAFIHEKYNLEKEINRFEGWWGTDENERFKMEKTFVPMEGAAAWQLSNAPIFNMVAHKASLSIFAKAGMEALRAKSKILTAYLEFLIKQMSDAHEDPLFEIITPNDPEKRGAQLSILCLNDGKKLFDYISSQGVIADWRNPNVIRVAPVPLYNSFVDVYQLAKIMSQYK